MTWSRLPYNIPWSDDDTRRVLAELESEALTLSETEREEIARDEGAETGAVMQRGEA